MGNRRLLSRSQLKAFERWLLKQGFVNEQCKGAYEVLRVRHPQSTDGPLIVFDRRRGAHYTLQEQGERMYRKWQNMLTIEEEMAMEVFIESVGEEYAGILEERGDL